MKFVDTTRAFIPSPAAFNEVELWVEKDSIRSFVEELAMKYRVPLQVERGLAPYPCLGMLLIRAREGA